MSDQTGVSTPEPVLKAAAVFGSIATVVVTVLGACVALGVLSNEEAASLGSLVDYANDNIVPIGTAVVGIVSVVSGLVASVATAFAARSKVVPIDSDVYTVTKTSPVAPAGDAGLGYSDGTY